MATNTPWSSPRRRGPITTVLAAHARLLQRLVPIENPGRMGPRLRGDDIECVSARRVISAALPARHFPGGAIQIFHSVDGPAWPWKNRCVVIASRSAPGAFAFIHVSQAGSR